MLIPVGEDVSVPVTVVVLGAEPEIWTASLRRLDIDRLRLRIDDGSIVPPPVGTRLIVNAGERTKLPGRLLEIADGELVVSRDAAHATDDRAAPRVRSRLSLRWRLTDLDRARTERWLEGGPDPGPFLVFQGGASLSMSGLRFPCRGPAPAPGSQLLLGLAIGGEERRALGAVRRLDTDGTEVSVAVEFLDLPEATFDALSQFTLDNL
jgi:hypothetical protein